MFTNREIVFNSIIEIGALAGVIYLMNNFKPTISHTLISKTTLDTVVRIQKRVKGWFRYMEYFIIIGVLGYTWFHTKNLFILFLFLYSAFMIAFPVVVMIRVVTLTQLKKSTKNLKGMKYWLTFSFNMAIYASILYSIYLFIFDLAK